ncbi:g4308 [Coccomyxa viridis]|uniref:G4308 protein n=1 Tax=Coccomyxa viridis TaxID=1274662 RepID=A0ABP1FPZ4_9CHLO
MLSKLVVFDTNVYMNHNHWDAKVIMQLLHAWILISPSIVILVPIEVMSELICLAASSSSWISQLAAAGLKVLKSVLASKIAHVQL